MSKNRHIFAIQDCNSFERNMTHNLSPGDVESNLFYFSDKFLNLIPTLLGETLCPVLCSKSILIKVSFLALKPEI